MAARDIIFVDTNTIWHRRIAIALGEEARVVGLAPRSGLGRSRGRTRIDNIDVLDVPLPPGWASRSAAIGQRLLARTVLGLAESLDDPVAILTSPAYEPLSRHLEGRLPLVTYTADDYGSYEGWRGARVREKRMQERADLSVFVSQALRDRAIREDGLSEELAVVSPNATEARFGGSPSDELPDALAGFARPIVGVLGGLSDRLDLDFLARVARLDTVGTFLVAGPLGAGIGSDHALLASPKTHVTGRLPHEEMHLYARAMDAAIIPYAATRLNHFCSPMRLFDHLASGAAIFALPTCDQVKRIEADRLFVGEADAILETLSQGIATERSARKTMPIFWSDRAKALLGVLDTVRRGA